MQRFHDRGRDRSHRTADGSTGALNGPPDVNRSGSPESSGGPRNGDPDPNSVRPRGTTTPPESEPLSLRLSRSRAGRVLLHLATYARSRKNFRWHLNCLLRDLLNRRPAKPPPKSPASDRSQ